MTDREPGKDPDDVIRELGGCGRFQIKLALTVHLINLVIVWSLHSMIFTTAAPKWQCADDNLDSSDYTLHSANNTLQESCTRQNGTACSHFVFAKDMRTIVSEVRGIVSNNLSKQILFLKII